MIFFIISGMAETFKKDIKILKIIFPIVTILKVKRMNDTRLSFIVSFIKSVCLFHEITDFSECFNVNFIFLEIPVNAGLIKVRIFVICIG
jgi:hypothetical protein